MKIDLGPLRKLEEEGLIRSQVHPEFPLIIWNYTEQTQFTKAWNEWTLMARGLITDQEGNIIARPFKKFFNYEEHTEALPDGTPEVVEKVDGSLGIVYWFDGHWHVATRGSFTSEQAIHARGLLEHVYGAALDKMPITATHLFEIVFPANRIVVDYGETDELVYLGSVDLETGAEAKAMVSDGYPWRSAQLHQVGWTKDELSLLRSENREGFVLRWPSGFRLKFKFEEYKRLHKILTNTTERSVWENMKEGKGIKELIEVVPDEFHKWVVETEAKIRGEYSRLCRESYEAVQHIRHCHHPETRREWAEHIKKTKYPSLCFGHLDGQDISKTVWQMIRPPATKPFSDKQDV